MQQLYEGGEIESSSIQLCVFLLNDEVYPLSCHNEDILSTVFPIINNCSLLIFILPFNKLGRAFARVFKHVTWSRAVLAILLSFTALFRQMNFLFTILLLITTVD